MSVPGMMEITRPLAEFVHETHFKDMPERVVQKAKECFLDWLGVTLGRNHRPCGRHHHTLLSILRGQTRSQYHRSSVRTDCASASLANGVIGHALDFDDYHDETVIHASAACIPAILPLPSATA